jgi:hypothetical protein
VLAIGISVSSQPFLQGICLKPECRTWPDSGGKTSFIDELRGSYRPDSKGNCLGPMADISTIHEACISGIGNSAN